MDRLPAAAAAELALLKAEHELLRPETVLEFARNETTSLHALFEWDDSAAAHQHRLDQARRVMRLYVEVIDSSLPPVRALVALSSDRGGYRATRQVLDNAQQRAVLVEDALQEFRRFRLKYERLHELADLWATADRIGREVKEGRGDSSHDRA